MKQTYRILNYCSDHGERFTYTLHWRKVKRLFLGKKLQPMDTAEVQQTIANYYGLFVPDPS